MSLFGPRLKDVFKEFSEGIGAAYHEKGLFSEPWLEIPHRLWTMHLDIYTQSAGQTSVQYTRLRVPVKRCGDYRISLYKQGFFSEIGKALGMQDIEVGYPGFDDAFVLKSNDGDHVIPMFQNEVLQAHLLNFPRIQVELKKGKGRDAENGYEGVITIKQQGIIKDIQKLEQLVALCRELTAAACAAGIIDEIPGTSRFHGENRADA